MSEFPSKRNKKRGGDPKVKGVRLKKNVRGSKAYKEDKKKRRKALKTPYEFTPKRVDYRSEQEGVRDKAQKSFEYGPPGKNDKQVQDAIKKLKNKKGKRPTTGSGGGRLRGNSIKIKKKP